MSTILIGIAGGTGSGKTTLTRHLKEHFGPEVTVIGHDNIFRHDYTFWNHFTCLLRFFPVWRQQLQNLTLSQHTDSVCPQRDAAVTPSPAVRVPVNVPS